MNANIRKLVADYVRRVPWWAWIFITAYHGLISWTYFNQRDAPLRMLSVIFIVMTASFLQNRNWMQIVRTMPISLREIGRARWWTGIAVPGLVLTIVALLTLLMLASVRHVRADGNGIVLLFVAPWAALGLWNSILALITYALRYNRLLAAILIIPLGALVIVVTAGVRVDQVWFWLASGLVGGLLLFVFAQATALSQSSARVPTASEAKFSKIDLLPSRFSGWAILARLQLSMTILMVTTFGAMSYLMNLLLRGKLPIDFYMLSPYIIVFSTAWFPSARMLRALPLTAVRLAAILQLSALAPTAILFAAIFIVSAMLPSKHPNLALIFPLILSLQTLQPPIKLRFGNIQAALLVTLMVVVAVMIIVFGTITTGPAAFLARWSYTEIALDAAIAVAGYLWTYYELSGGTHAYRARLSTTPGLGQFSGRMAGLGR